MPPSHSVDRHTARPRCCLGLIVIAAVICATVIGYWVVLPRGLTPWTSPAIRGADKHVKVLIPAGWELERPAEYREEHGAAITFYVLSQPDHTPEFVRMAFPPHRESASIAIKIVRALKDAPLRRPQESGVILTDLKLIREAERYVMTPDRRILAHVLYLRGNVDEFDKTYKKICESLKVE